MHAAIARRHRASHVGAPRRHPRYAVREGGTTQALRRGEVARVAGAEAPEASATVGARAGSQAQPRCAAATGVRSTSPSVVRRLSDSKLITFRRGMHMLAIAVAIRLEAGGESLEPCSTAGPPTPGQLFRRRPMRVQRASAVHGALRRATPALPLRIKAVRVVCWTRIPTTGAPGSAASHGGSAVGASRPPPLRSVPRGSAWASITSARVGDGARRETQGLRRSPAPFALAFRV